MAYQVPGMKRLLLVGGFCLFLSGCAHTLTVQEKADFDEIVSKESFQSKKSLPASHKFRIPLWAGQWVKILTTFKDTDGKIRSESLATYKVIGVRRDTVALEIETVTAGKPKPMTIAFIAKHIPLASNAMGMTKDDLNDIMDDLEFKKVITQSGDSMPQQVPLNLVNMATKSYADKLMVSGYRIGNTKKEPCATENMHSPSCIGYNFQVDGFGKTLRGHVDAHSAIPIVGFVKQDGETYTSRVVAYGLSGAKGKLITRF